MDDSEFMPGPELCRLKHWPTTTFQRRVDLGEIELHLINRKVMVRVSEAEAAMAKVKRRNHLKSRDLFAA